MSRSKQNSIKCTKPTTINYSIESSINELLARTALEYSQGYFAYLAFCSFFIASAAFRKNRLHNRSDLPSQQQLAHISRAPPRKSSRLSTELGSAELVSYLAQWDQHFAQTTTTTTTEHSTVVDVLNWQASNHVYYFSNKLELNEIILFSI